MNIRNRLAVSQDDLRRGQQDELFRAVLGLVLATSCAVASCAWGQDIKQRTAPAPGIRPSATGNGDSIAPVIGQDGRFVLFASTANNLVVRNGTNEYPAYL